MTDMSDAYETEDGSYLPSVVRWTRDGVWHLRCDEGYTACGLRIEHPFRSLEEALLKGVSIGSVCRSCLKTKAFWEATATK